VILTYEYSAIMHCGLRLQLSDQIHVRTPVWAIRQDPRAGSNEARLIVQRAVILTYECSAR